MASPKPILIGVDGSDAARRAVIWGAVEAQRHGSTVRIVHVYSPIGADPTWGGSYGLDVSEASSRRLVDEAARMADDRVAGIVAESQSVCGPPARTLIDMSQDASMAVVGSRGRSQMRMLVLGSVAMHVATHAACPTTVVRGTPSERGPITVGVDLSASSEHALGAAFEEAALRKAPLVAFHACQVPDASGYGVWDLPEDFQRELAAEASCMVAEAIEPWMLKYPAVNVVQDVHAGHPAEGLLAAARKSRLLVVGCHGRGAFGGLLLGSVGAAAIRHAACSVLVVR